jgi:hypothetical protein
METSLRTATMIIELRLLICEKAAISTAGIWTFYVIQKYPVRQLPRAIARPTSTESLSWLLLLSSWPTSAISKYEIPLLCREFGESQDASRIDIVHLDWGFTSKPKVI